MPMFLGLVGPFVYQTQTLLPQTQTDVRTFTDVCRYRYSRKQSTPCEGGLKKQLLHMTTTSCTDDTLKFLNRSAGLSCHSTCCTCTIKQPFDLDGSAFHDPPGLMVSGVSYLFQLLHAACVNNDPASGTLPPGSRLLKGAKTHTHTHRTL